MSEVIEIPDIQFDEGLIAESTQQQENIEQAQMETARFRFAMIGQSYLTDAMRYMHANEFWETKVFEPEQIDDLVEWNPGLTYVCLDLPFTKNELQDDTYLLDIVKKLNTNPTGGICIKTTISSETLERLYGAIGVDRYNSRIIYSPEIENTVDGIINSEHLLIGSFNDKLINQHMEFISKGSFFSGKKLIISGPFDICFTKLAVSGYRAVKQGFFTELYKFSKDYAQCDFNFVRNNLESIDFDNKKYSIPTVLRAPIDDPEISPKLAKSLLGEYQNDVRCLVGSTDKMSILDAALNQKNI